MKFSESWLRTVVNPKVDTQGLAEQLTMAGLEVESITPVAPDFSGVFVGQILHVSPHPDADRLKLCKVSIGHDEPLSIVCGAPNAASEMKVAVALVGAVLPNNFKIKAQKVRGVASQGMLCAAEELGLADDSEGILELSPNAPLGESFREYWQLDDHCLEVDLTPNRGDCLSIRGLARELAVLKGVSPQLPVYEQVPPQHDSVFPVFVEAPEACPQYLGRLLNGVDQGETPVVVKERLRRAGIRCVNPVVDATQYVMLALGQPMHAFDARELDAQINIRFAQRDEPLTLLDGRDVRLTTQTLVIADAKGPVALAGVMGGSNSSVKHHTKDVFLECAYFEPLALAGIARSYALHTEASHRFERGIDPQLCRQALEYATQLIVEWTGAQPGPVIEVLNEHSEHSQAAIQLPVVRIMQLLGVEWPVEWVVTTLQRLGCEVGNKNCELNEESRTSQNELCITPPSFRHDLTCDADLIEELARVYGYHRLPVRMPLFSMQALGSDMLAGGIEAQVSRSELRSRLIAQGFHEVINYSFIHPKWSALLQGSPVVPAELSTLDNPLSEDLSVMRTSLWPGLLETLHYNQKRQHAHLKLFEQGVCFLPSGNIRPVEEHRIAGLWCGNRLPVGWTNGSEPIDFFDLKGDIEQLLSHLKGRLSFKPREHPVLHPQQSAQIWVDNNIAGWLGKAHPSLLKKLSLDGSVYLFELTFNSINGGKLPVFKAVSKFPEIKRDIALLFPEAVLMGDITAAVHATDVAWLKALTLFDVYVGEGVNPGLKSMALTLRFQHPERTLKDAEVDKAVDQVIMCLKDRWQAVLRN